MVRLPLGGASAAPLISHASPGSGVFLQVDDNSALLQRHHVSIEVAS
jgi:hypothetical protein